VGKGGTRVHTAGMLNGSCPAQPSHYGAGVPARGTKPLLRVAVASLLAVDADRLLNGSGLSPQG
jgi:hypothetical protein